MSKLSQKILALSKNKEARTLASNFTWLAILKIIAYLFPLITLPYLARVIGVDGFGEIAFAVSVMIFIETLVDFGFNYTATRDIARQRNDILAVSKVFSNVMWAKIFLMCIGFGILCLLIWIIPSLYDKRLLLFLTFLYIPGHIFSPDWFFQAMEKMKYITILNVLSKLLFTVLIFIVIKEKDDYVWQPLLTAIGYCISGICAMWVIIKTFNVKITPPNFRSVWSTIKGSWNMFLSLLLPNLYTNFSTILLRSSCGEIATGLYNAGQRFISIIDQLIQVLSRTFYPFLARRLDKHSMYVKISGTLSLIASIMLYGCSDLLIKIFFSPEFDSASIVIRIMAIAPFSLFLMNTYGVNYLVLVGEEKIYRNIIFIFSIIGFITTWILTIRYSYIGTATTISGIWLLRGLTTFVYAKRHMLTKKKQS